MPTLNDIPTSESDVVISDPALAVDVCLAQAEVLRLQVEWTLASDEDDVTLHDLSPPGRGVR